MLNIILGRSGFGKTEYIRDKAIELALKNEKVLLIVPDQVSFDTEKYMLFKTDEHTSSKIDVFHFGRICEEVFRLYGGVTETKIDDSSKSLIMSFAVAQCKDQLQLFEKTGDTELSKLMISAMSELKSNGINSKDLFDMRNEFDGVLATKLYEIALMYESFEAICENSYVEPDDMMARAGKTISGTDYFKDKIVLIDGFEGFDNGKLSILRSAFEKAKEIHISFCSDDIYSEDDGLFEPINDTALKILALARETGRKIIPFTRLKENLRTKSMGLKTLEERLFRNIEAEKIKTDDIKIFEAKDIYEETDFICATIKRLVCEGYSFDDFTVITRNDKKYTAVIENSFDKYEIPVFISKGIVADSTPLVRLILSAFAVCEYGFRSETLLSMAKTGLCGLNSKEISELENYVYLWKIDGVKWKNKFERSPFGFDTREFEEELSVIEDYRQRLISPIIKFIVNCKQENGIGISTAIYDLIENYSVETKIIENFDRLNEISAVQEASEQIRVWNSFMEILDKFAKIIGEQKISVSKYSALLKDILSKEELLDIPLNIDTVIYGTASNLKHSSKIVFLLGCVRDEFPLLPSQNAVFSLKERELLEEQSFHLQTNYTYEILLERFYAYTSACSASEKLYITYHKNFMGTEILKSELVSSVLENFDIDIIRDLSRDYFAVSYKALFSECSRSLSTNETVSSTLLSIASENEELIPKINSLKRIIDKKDFSLEKNVAREVQANLRYSPSQIETYHRCKFQYFCKFNLSAKQRRQAEVDSIEYGILIHFIFENVLKDGSFRDKSNQEIIDWIDRLLEEYSREKMGGKEVLSEFDLYRFKRMKNTAVFIVFRMIEELRQSKFDPKFFELRLKEGTKFPPVKIETENGMVEVTGVADRVDVYEKDGEKYARIIDYKTGSKELKLSDIVNGLNLQMPIYLYALQESGYIPSAALYMMSKSPVVTADSSLDEAKITAKQYEKTQMKGLVMDDISIIKAMEENIEGKYLPVKLYKNGNYTSRENILNSQEFESLFEYTKKLIVKMSEELINGNICAKPQLNNVMPCEWCDYKAVCGTENMEEINSKLKKDDAMKIMREEETYEKVD